MRAIVIIFISMTTIIVTVIMIDINASPDMTGEPSSPGITGETITTTDLENIDNYNEVTTPMETTPAVTTCMYIFRRIEYKIICF